jgi:hypothetical protein
LAQVLEFDLALLGKKSAGSDLELALSASQWVMFLPIIRILFLNAS